MARQKQSELAGIGRKEIKEIDEAAEDYVKVRDERMALTKKEVEAKKKLQDLMKDHKLKAYSYEGARIDNETGEEETVERLVKVEKVEKLSVRVPKDNKPAPEEEEEEEKE